MSPTPVVIAENIPNSVTAQVSREAEEAEAEAEVDFNISARLIEAHSELDVYGSTTELIAQGSSEFNYDASSNTLNYNTGSFTEIIQTLTTRLRDIDSSVSDGVISSRITPAVLIGVATFFHLSRSEYLPVLERVFLMHESFFCEFRASDMSGQTFTIAIGRESRNVILTYGGNSYQITLNIVNKNKKEGLVSDHNDGYDGNGDNKNTSTENLVSNAPHDATTSTGVHSSKSEGCTTTGYVTTATIMYMAFIFVDGVMSRQRLKLCPSPFKN